MRPEKKTTSNPEEDLKKLGIPEIWIPVLIEMGFENHDDLKDANPNKLFNDLNGMRKKKKLNTDPVKKEDILSWCS